MLLSMTSKGEEHVRIAKVLIYHKPQRRWRINFLGISRKSRIRSCNLPLPWLYSYSSCHVDKRFLIRNTVDCKCPHCIAVYSCLG